MVNVLGLFVVVVVVVVVATAAAVVVIVSAVVMNIIYTAGTDAQGQTIRIAIGCVSQDLDRRRTSRLHTRLVSSLVVHHAIGCRIVCVLRVLQNHLCCLALGCIVCIAKEAQTQCRWCRARGWRCVVVGLDDLPPVGSAVCRCYGSACWNCLPNTIRYRQIAVASMLIVPPYAYKLARSR
jgi:hypothetical protein